jgi:hypothetical protein
MDLEPTRPQKRKTTRPPSAPKAKSSPSPATVTSQRVSPCDDLHILIAQRAYRLHCERGYRHGCALDDWLEAEREILSQSPPGLT